jgi:dimethylaniline monooxygenase (N-oxide forming)
VIATGGVNGVPTHPKIEGEDIFRGKIMHSRAFKRPGDFAGKRVMVVGFGNTAADTATQLAGVAGEVYLSHRHGAYVVGNTSYTAGGAFTDRKAAPSIGQG